ncbi:MAG: hypothetical protein D6744_09060, partial [Planctomycetota bacterium]
MKTRVADRPRRRRGPAADPLREHMSSTPTLTDRVARIAKLSVRMTAVAGSGHPSSALSLAHIIAYLMN